MTNAPTRRDVLKALAALPVAGRLDFGTTEAPLVDGPLVDLRDRRAENQQELVILMTPAVFDDDSRLLHSGDAGASPGRQDVLTYQKHTAYPSLSFDPERRRKQAERLAEALAIGGRHETYITWDDPPTDHRSLMRQYGALTKEMVARRITPRSFVVATHEHAAAIPIHPFSLADAWVNMRENGEGVARLIEHNPYADQAIARRAGTVSL